MADVRTEPVAPKSVAGPKEGTDEKAEKKYAANEVPISRGRLIKLRVTNAMDDIRIERVIFDAYANDMGIVPPNIAMRAEAINAIMAISNEPMGTINSRQDFEKIVFSLSSDDMAAINDKYLELTGRKSKMQEAIKEVRARMRGDIFPHETGERDA